jgi:hypothetical protein
MKKLFLIGAAACLFMSCNNEQAKEGEKLAEVKPDAAKVTLPQKMIYQATAAAGNQQNVVEVMNFNADFIGGKLDNIGSYLADSVHAIFADGTEMNITRDSMVSVIKAWRGSMDSARQTYISAIAVNNSDNGDEWVMQWIDEEHFYKGGKKEHYVYHEDYRLVKGKVREMFQHQQGIPAKK